MKFPFVEIEWVDSHIESEWISLKDAKEKADHKDSMTMLTSGYLVADELSYLMVAGTVSIGIDEPDLVNGTMQIPRSAVVKLEQLRP